MADSIVLVPSLDECEDFLSVQLSFVVCVYRERLYLARFHHSPMARMAWEGASSHRFPAILILAHTLSDTFRLAVLPRRAQMHLCVAHKHL